MNVEITAVPLCAQAFFLQLDGKRFPAERCRRLSKTFTTKIIKNCAKAKFSVRLFGIGLNLVNSLEFIVYS